MNKKKMTAHQNNRKNLKNNNAFIKHLVIKGHNKTRAGEIKLLFRGYIIT